MCIRDRALQGQAAGVFVESVNGKVGGAMRVRVRGVGSINACLLYTSDAADERSSVDLGGRRIINKKKSRVHGNASTCIS